MQSRVRSLRSLEVLDSRGHPTIRTWVTLEDESVGVATVPAGIALVGTEAAELRDGDLARYRGRGVLKAVANVEGEIANLIVGADATDQQRIDEAMIQLDGSSNKGRLGANAILSVSMATAAAAARSLNVPLYRYLGGASATRLPVPMFNVLNGGCHADNNIATQEFMIVPVGAPCFREALRYGSEVFYALKGILLEMGHSTAVGDEGGFAPDLKCDDEACSLIVAAIEAAGFRASLDIALAIDVAASHLKSNDDYRMGPRGEVLTRDNLLKRYELWAERFPIVSIEDGFSDDDWEGFRLQTMAMGRNILVVGDDLYVTKAARIDRGGRELATNAVLIKLNQIGTVTETIEAVEHCKKTGMEFIVSHRSGETEDVFIADFAVAMGGGIIKTGSLSRSDRIAKYNRLLEIERELGEAATYRWIND